MLNNALHLMWSIYEIILSFLTLERWIVGEKPTLQTLTSSLLSLPVMSQLLRTLLSSHNLFSYMLLFLILCTSIWLLRSPLSDLLYFLPLVTHNKLLQCEYSKLGFCMEIDYPNTNHNNHGGFWKKRFSLNLRAKSWEVR